MVNDNVRTYSQWLSTLSGDLATVDHPKLACTRLIKCKSCHIATVTLEHSALQTSVLSSVTMMSYSLIIAIILTLPWILETYPLALVYFILGRPSGVICLYLPPGSASVMLRAGLVSFQNIGVCTVGSLCYLQWKQKVYAGALLLPISCELGTQCLVL